MNFFTYLLLLCFSVFPYYLLAQHLKGAAIEYNSMFASQATKIWQTEKLKGRAKTCLLIDDKQDSTFYFYNKNGQLEKLDAEIYEVIYEFNGKKQLVKKTYQSKSRCSSSFKVIQFFDASGFLEKIEEENNFLGHWQNFKITCAYNPITKELKKDYEHKSLYLAEDEFRAVFCKFETDPKTNQITKSICSSERFDSTTHHDTTAFVYDGDLLIMCNDWGTCWPGEDCFGIRRVSNMFIYDHIGNLLIETSHDRSDDTSETAAYSFIKRNEYNDKNDVVKTIFYNANGKEGISGEFFTYSMLENQEQFTTYFEYEYDKKGNWIVQKMISQTDAKPKVLKTTRRQIVYY